MKDKLTLEDLAPYLPYKVKFFINMTDINPDAKKEERVFTLTPSNSSLCFGHGTLYLRPLSDLTNEIEHSGRKYFLLSLWLQYELYGTIPEYWKNVMSAIKSHGIEHLDHGIVKLMYKHHFDVNGLIERGLAIDMNTIKVNQ